MLFLNAEILRALLSYDPATGLFTWLHNPKASAAWNDRYSGRIADEINEDGYVIILIRGKAYLAHRLAWLFMTGNWPGRFVDHKDRVRTNNAWDNLRLATPGQNAANISIRNDNTTRHKGVSFKKQTGRWRARITLGGKTKHLGYFATKDEAAEAYRLASLELHHDFSVHAA